MGRGMQLFSACLKSRRRMETCMVHQILTKISATWLECDDDALAANFSIKQLLNVWWVRCIGYKSLPWKLKSREMTGCYSRCVFTVSSLSQDGLRNSHINKTQKPCSYFAPHPPSHVGGIWWWCVSSKFLNKTATKCVMSSLYRL